MDWVGVEPTTCGLEDLQTIISSTIEIKHEQAAPKVEARRRSRLSFVNCYDWIKLDNQSITIDPMSYTLLMMSFDVIVCYKSS
jgi:hypothetical protein